MPLKSTAEVFRYGKIDIDNTQDDRLDTIESDLQTKVNRAGDTMSGQLVLNSGLNVSNGDTFVNELRFRRTTDNNTGSGSIVFDSDNMINFRNGSGGRGFNFITNDLNNNLSRVVIRGNNVGIGLSEANTSTPLARLHVLRNTGDVFRCDDTSNDTTPFIINGSGNVGIGTSNPRAPLQIGTGEGVKIVFAEFNGIAGTNLTHSQNWTLDFRAGRGQETSNLGNFRFFTSGTSGYDERMRINQDGNVGIGTTTPAERLDVNGNARISGNVGIGPAFTPLEPLHVNGNAILRGMRFTNAVNFGYIQAPPGNNGIRFSPFGNADHWVEINSSSSNRLNVVGNIEATGTITGSQKFFKINHPDPEKTDTHDLYHTSIESNTAGTCHYEYKVYVENTKVIELPSYFKHLIDYNSIKCYITPIGQFVMVCYNVIDDSHIEIKTSSPTNVAVMVTGVRKDCGALKNWQGPERLKPEPKPEPEPEPLQEESQEIYTGITEETQEDEYKEEEIQQQEQEENHTA